MAIIDRLAPLRAHTGARRTTGLDDATVERFAASHPDLVEAIDAAVGRTCARARRVPRAAATWTKSSRRRSVQGGYVNFYSDDTVNPYVALVARGPWVVTLNGAVLHDSGGYGMLGFGHTPQRVLDAMAKPQVMANIMTPNLSQLRFDRALRAEVGHTRGGCPYSKFLCLNSGSESVSLACAHRRRQRQADDRCRWRAMPAARSSAWWSRAASTAAPSARRCTPTPRARPTSSTWPASAARTRCSPSSPTTSTR